MDIFLSLLQVHFTMRHAFILETEVLFRGIQMMVQAALCVECWYYLAVQKKKLWLILGILWIFINAWTVWQFIQACMALV